MARASRILLVDDEIAILEITKEFLEFTVASSIDTASTVQEALDKLKDERYDAIVSDYQMPGMNGIEFLRKVRESDATIAFVLFTGKGREEVAIEAINSGADFYIKKGGEATAQFAELGNAVNQAIARRQAERAHAQAEELYTSLYNNILDVYYIHDLNGNFLDVNPAGVSQFGYGLDETRKLNFLDILHPDDRHRATTAVKDLVESGRTVGTREYRIRRKDGEYVTVEISSSVLKRDGVPVAIQGVARDVTSRKRLEDAMRENEAFLDRVLSKSPVGVLVLDGRELRVRLMNQHYQQNFLDEPYRDAKLVGKRLEEFIPGIENTEVPALLHRVADTGVPFVEKEYRFTGFKRGVTYWNMAYHQIQVEGEKGVLVVANEVTEQVVMRMAVESSEAKYRSLFDSMQDAYVRVDMEGHIIDSNEAYRRMLGYTTEELANLTYPDFTPQKWHEMEQNIVADAFLRGHSEVYEKEYIRKDGTVFPVELHAFVIKNVDGKPMGMWGIARDITERKRAESELRKSEGRYRSLIESLTDAYIQVDLQGRFVECNSGFKRLTGYADEELEPLTTTDITPPRWREVQEEMVRRTIATGSSGMVEKELFRRDGTTVPVMMNTYLIRDDLGHPVGRWSIMHDITDIKRAETALAREHGLAQNYLDLAGFIFIGLDREHKITILNRKGSEILGIECQDAIGRDWVELAIPSRLRPEVEATFGKLISGEIGPVEYFENPIVSHSGEERLIAWHNAVLRDEQGQVIGTLSSGEDVTDRKRALDASAEATSKLRLLARITSHDIQNQLMVLGGLIQKARREHSQIVVRELLARMQGAADKIQMHLTFAREYQNLGRSPPVWQDVDTLVRDLVSRFESKFVQFSVDAQDVEVYADLMLNRAFYNLIDNTLKHGQKASRIEVTAKENDGVLLLTYRDDGVGVPVNQKKAIFEKRPEYDGPQGLMLVSEILGITGIRIEETGVPGQGATFEMIVPRGSFRYAANDPHTSRFVSLDSAI